MLGSLSSRAALVTGAVAAVAVLIAGVVALPLIRDAAQAQAQSALASQADLVRDVAIRPNDFDLDNDHGNGNPDRALLGLVSYLRAQGVTVEPIIPGSTVPALMTGDQIQTIITGHSVSGRKCTQGTCVFVEARPVGTGTGIVLIQPVSVVSSVTSTAIGRIAIALVIGFIVAVVIGLVAARRLVRPLANAADAAHRLALGERDVRVTPEGPAEVAEIAVALNVLAEELAYSEGRQREFFLSISHELRTPLTAIRGYAEALSDGMIGAEDAVQVGNVVSAESLRLDRLVSDLLDLARTGAVDFPVNVQTVDLVELVSDAGEVWESRCAKEGTVFSMDLPVGPVHVSTDPIRVRQIIDNLAENALRVTPAGSPIVFAVTAPGTIEVRDGGPGLSDNDIAVAFEPGELYERYKGVRKVGTGFGLALVGRLASRLGAHATAGKSSEGGAVFRIDFSTPPKPIN